MSDRKHPINWTAPSLLSPYFLLLGAIVGVFCFVNVRWIWSFRYNQPLDIDEAGYLSYALIDYSNLIHDGFAGLLHAIAAPSIQAPLTTALSALLFYLTGPHIIVGFVVPLLAGAACLLAVFALGAAVSRAEVGVLAALVLATCPVTLNYVRSYHFSMLAMLIATCALLALARSDRMRKLPWVMAFGLCLGLLPLARTMTIAFLPGLMAGALCAVLAAPDKRLFRLAMLGLAVLLGGAVLALWLVPHFGDVAHYLFNFGYGSRAAEYHKCANCAADIATGPAFFAAWLTTLQAMINGDIYLPDFLFLCAGLLAAGFIAVRYGRQEGVKALLLRIWRSPLLPSAIFALEALAAINSSINKGSAFFAPVMPVLFLLAVFFLDRLSARRVWGQALTGLVAGFAVLVGLPFVSLTSHWADPTNTSLPVLQGVTVTDGRGTIERYEAVGGFGQAQDLQPLDPATGRAWMAASAATGNAVLSLAGHQAVVTFGFRNHLYNVNTVNLEMILHAGVAFAMNQIDPQVTGDSVAAYRNWLQQDAGNTCVLLTSNSIVAGDFNPVVVRSFMTEAAVEAGYTPRQSWPLPDGEQIILWLPRHMPAGCHPEAVASQHPERAMNHG
jgi:hypothetical protein